jgi:hypothetical protein
LLCASACFIIHCHQAEPDDLRMHQHASLYHILYNKKALISQGFLTP